MPTTGPALQLRREVLAAGPVPELDPAQQRVVDHRGGTLRVLGAPGTGKTTALVEAVVSRVLHDGVDPGEVLVLAPTRVAAARLRERRTARPATTAREPRGRTAQAPAVGVLGVAGQNSVLVLELDVADAHVPPPSLGADSPPRT